ncbi:hypothetical protein [Sphingomonas sp.]|uniref:hypothetical protein n=1 Tax=Sphingomonas sp. TaxID=28214 RepID=UPI00286BF385|nr:hypothetical protein [Sphingomonas sp.]
MSIALPRENIMRLKYLALFATLSISAPVLGCEIDTPTDWLPGFSKQQVEERRSEILTAWSNVREDSRIEALVEHAPVVYLARVVKSDPNMEAYRFSTVVKPLKPIKGAMPEIRKLEGSMPSSCGDPNGDGDAPLAKVGELVVVFEGVKKHEHRPRGIDSVRMIGVHSGVLLDHVQEWLSEQPDYPPVH